jgi:3-phenylpropionate/trans-cinnamate dioxygenase ferredoxin reductase subunit
MTAPLEPSDHVVVVGAGLAGWRFAEALRRDGFSGQLTLVGAENHEPYDRPPLSKQVLSGQWGADKIVLAATERLSELAITTRLGSPAVHLDVEHTTVDLGDGSEVRGTHVVIATGSRARQLPYSAANLHTVRTIDDAHRLLDATTSLPTRATVVVIGGGFVGAEVATSLHARGLAPIVLEVMAKPLLNVVGDEAAGWLLGLASEAGIELRVSQKVVDVISTDDGFGVVLGDGTTIATPLVVVSVGAEPNVEWLENSGLEIRDGVVVNDHLMATATVGAIGDVARFTWRHDPFVEEVRIEHWQTANDHANALAAHLSGSSSGPLSMVPYFWSDQYGRKIQMLGHPQPTDTITRVAGSVDDGKWLAVYSRDGVATGLIGLNQPRGLMLSKPIVDSHLTLDDALAAAPWSP